MSEYRKEFFLLFSNVVTNLGKKDLRPFKRELFREIDETIAHEDDLGLLYRRQTQLEPQDKELLWRFFIANAFSGEHAKKTRMWGKV